MIERHLLQFPLQFRKLLPCRRDFSRTCVEGSYRIGKLATSALDFLPDYASVFYKGDLV